MVFVDIDLMMKCTKAERSDQTKCIFKRQSTDFKLKQEMLYSLQKSVHSNTTRTRTRNCILDKTSPQNPELAQ